MSVMKKFLTAITLLATCLTTVAQTEQNDLTPDIEKAYQLYKSGKYQEAYEQAYIGKMSNPENPYSYILIAELLFFGTNDYCETLRVLDEGMANVHPTDTASLIQLRLHKGEYNLTLRLYDEALEEFNKVLEYDPDNESAHLRLIRTLSYSGDYEEVIRRGEINLSHPDIDDQSKAFYYSFIGDAYYELKEYDKVIEYTNKLIEITERTRYKSTILSLALRELGRYEESLELLIEETHIDPDFIHEYPMSFHSNDYINLAIAKFKEERDNDNINAEFWDNLIIDTYSQNLKFYEASQYIIENCQDIDTLYYASLLSECGPSMQDKALQYVNELNDDYYFSINNIIRSQIYLNTGRYQEALDEINITITVDIFNEKSYLIRGYINECLGNYDAAIEDYTLSLIILEEKVFYFMRGRVYQLMGDTANAEADFNQILNTHCESNSDYRAMAIMQAYLGNEDEALEAAGKIEDMPLIDKHILFASVYSLLGNAEEAMQHITWATENGFRHFDIFSYDPFFENIRGSEQLQSLITTYDK